MNISKIFKDNPVGLDDVHWTLSLKAILGDNFFSNGGEVVEAPTEITQEGDDTLYRTIVEVDSWSSEKHYILVEQVEEYGHFFSADFKEVSHKDFIDFYKETSFFLEGEEIFVMKDGTAYTRDSYYFTPEDAIKEVLGDSREY